MTRPSTRAIRDLREEMGLTQGALAARAGVSQGYLSQMEAEDRSASLDTFRRLADGMGIPLCGLLARLGLDCGCSRDWGALSRYPVMELFGRLSAEDSALVVELMGRLARGQSQA